MTREDDRGTVTFEVELTQAFVDLVREEEDDDVYISEWLVDAAEMKMRERFWRDGEAISVDVPEKLAKRAELLAENARVRHGKKPPYNGREDWLADMVGIEYEFPDEDDSAEDGGSE
jgi:hypothetical protein